jgi:1-deoxy-D-xylulose-5-phosphate reductoisomerase
MKKKLCVLGSTGSIGRNTLNVVDQHPEYFSIDVLVTNKNTELLAEQIKIHKPKFAVIYDFSAYTIFKQKSDGLQINVVFGIEGFKYALEKTEPDLLINAFVGFAGLKPTVEALRLGIDVALANKETLVVAGELIDRLKHNFGVALFPIDSEHSAIWQCLVGEEGNKIKRIFLTASGGPFRKYNKSQLDKVTPAEALRHPNWNMGAKITIDSATLMNKGLEVIEAFWLYKVALEKISVLIHPQSIIHSMVEFEDNSIKAQLGVPDMRIPIQYALSYPKRYPLNIQQIDFIEFQSLTFEKPDLDKFPCLGLAYQALKQGKTYPAALNASNEEAVSAFLNKKIKFTEIPMVIEEVLDKHSANSDTEIENYLSVDHEARKFANELIKKKQN